MESKEGNRCCMPEMQESILAQGEKMITNNHPKKGSIIVVEPIRESAAVSKIKDLLKNNPRDYAIFVLGCNTNLRASDIVNITIGQVRGLKPLDILTVREKKTGKLRNITVNQTVYEALKNLLAGKPDAADDAPLFPSRKGHKALSVSSLNHLVKLWCSKAKLKGNFGSHSLRKTFGYFHYKVFRTDIVHLTKLFNHSSTEITMRYLGIQPEELQSAYLKEI